MKKWAAGWRSTFAAIMLLAAPCWSAAAATDPRDEARAYLEGIWLFGRVPDKGDCISHWYDGETQIEFEFRVSGGRALIFEPHDLFTAVQIPKMETSGNEALITARGRDGAEKPFWRIRMIAPDQMEFVPLGQDGSAGKTSILHRCGTPNLAVNQGVPMAVLRAVAPELTGSASFPSAVDGVPDSDICEGRGYVERLRAGIHQGSIQFELLGPVHYWVMSDRRTRSGRLLEFDYVRSIKQETSDTLKLVMQEHRGGTGGWDGPAPRGAIYELTIVIKDKRIDIPELSESFIRCDPPHRGAHRW